MSVYLMGCYFIYTVLSKQFELFSDECAIVKEVHGRCMLSQISKLK